MEFSSVVICTQANHNAETTTKTEEAFAQKTQTPASMMASTPTHGHPRNTPDLSEPLVSSTTKAGSTPVSSASPWSYFSDHQKAAALAVMEKYGLHTEIKSPLTPNIDHPSFDNVDEWRSVTQSYLAHDIKRSMETQDSFWIVDFGAVICQLARWIRELPTVQPFYAMKCNDHPALVELLKALGTGFDCASQAEFGAMIRMGLDPQRIIYANPCKPASHCRAAMRQGLSHCTFDSLHELDKIAECWPNAGLVLRLATDDKDSVCEFSSKFGATMTLVPQLIDRIIELNLTLVGVSFHVGSGCGNPSVFTASVRDAAATFALARARGITTMKVLDIGGGFPGDRVMKPSFEALAQEIRSALDIYFPEHSDPSRPLQVIAEPGRFFAASSHTLVCNIYGKRVINLADYRAQPAPKPAERQPSLSSLDSVGEQTPPVSPTINETSFCEVQYYLNDGVYQSFNCKFFDHVEFTPDTLIPVVPRDPQSPTIRSTVFGPTCDALDCIVKGAQMHEFHVGEWLFIRNFGAYTRAAASGFNGYGTNDTIFLSCVPAFPTDSTDADL